ncbi:MAG: VOC family protein [Vicinamibacterales bacterium]
MKFTGLTPNLVSTDVARALAFYRDVLGFTLKANVPDAPPYVFVWLERDGVNVFVNDVKAVREDLPDVPSLEPGRSGVAMFLAVEGVRALWDDLRERTTVVMPLKTQWYGMTEFAITDPDGYVITFAERTGDNAK